MAIDGAGLIITGRSGAGKSTLALQMIALGAKLVSDDGVNVVPRESGLWLEAPAPLRNRIEARGLGILACENGPAWARAVLALDETEQSRLPKTRETVIAGVSLPLLRKVEGPAFPSMLMLYLSGGLHADATGD